MTACQPHEIIQWVVYYDPRDYPGQYVVRRWIIGPPNEPRADPEPYYVGPNLDLARSVLPPLLYRLEPFPGEDPAICEVWL